MSRWSLAGLALCTMLVQFLLIPTATAGNDAAITIQHSYLSSDSIVPGKMLTIYYEIDNPTFEKLNVWLGASVRHSSTGTIINDKSNDTPATIEPGKKLYQRSFVIPASAPLGSYDYVTTIWDSMPPYGNQFYKTGWITDAFNISPTIVSFEPRTTVRISGNYNEETGWYYGSAPVATFTATSSISNIKEIVVFHKSFDEKCSKGKCLLRTGDSLKLDKRTGLNEGIVTVHYYALDSEGRSEKLQTLSVRVDAQAPDVYLTKISTTNKGDIPIGSLCKAKNKCIISVDVDEAITFEMFGSDRISGIKGVYYKLDKGLSWNKVEDQVPRTVNMNFEKSGQYRVQFKAVDIAGNESAIKEFIIRIR